MVNSNYYIWLQAALGAGAVTENIFSVFNSPEEVYRSSEKDLRLSGVFSSAQVYKLLKTDIAESYEVIADCAARGIDIITPKDELYPQSLLQLRNYPLVLYAKGDLSKLKDTVPISIVGARKATPKSLAAASELAKALTKSGFTVVSGGALGVDSAAHTGALLAGGQTIAVLGCGIGCRYLMENEPLRRAIAESGALLSELRPGESGHRGAFPMRNRIISGITVGTIVIEAGVKSGSLITAKYAAEQNRDVFAVPGDGMGSAFLGADELIRDGAKSVENPFDVIEEYIGKFPGRIIIDESVDLMRSIIGNEPEYFEYESVKTFESEKYIVAEEHRERGHKKVFIKKREITDSVTDTAKIVYEIFEEKPLSVNEIAEKLNFPVNLVLGSLTELEILGYIEMFGNTKYRLNLSK